MDPLIPDDNELKAHARMEINSLLDAYDDQMRSVAQIRDQLHTLRIQARSVDGTIEATVDSAGVVTEIQLKPAALRNKPDKLAQMLTEVIREAATHAERYAAQTVEPLNEIVGRLPDLPDLLPGAPSLRDPFPIDREDDAPS
ncbi:YbaB/EbfC family nucleoid-associated protein [Nocardia sp. NPDC052254]